MDKKLDLGDQIVVSEPTHPFYRFTGTIVGRRGFRVPGDAMLLILINERQRSFLIPESMVTLTEAGNRSPGQWKYPGSVS